MSVKRGRVGVDVRAVIQVGGRGQYFRHFCGTLSEKGRKEKCGNYSGRSVRDVASLTSNGRVKDGSQFRQCSGCETAKRSRTFHNKAREKGRGVRRGREVLMIFPGRRSMTRRRVQRFLEYTQLQYPKMDQDRECRSRRGTRNETRSSRRTGDSTPSLHKRVSLG
jgi:hypothetical protein